jgi:hypothetical protein
MMIYLIESQKCISNKGTDVDWWIVMKVPGIIKKTGYGYFDSTMITGKF